MRAFFSMLLILLLGSSLLFTDAYAKRFGSGRSFGVQRSYNSYNKQPTTYANRGANRNPSRWGGLLGGLLIGGLLGSLLMGNGLASGLFTWLMLGVLVFLLFNFMRKKKEGMMPNSANPYQFSNQSAFKSPFNFKDSSFQVDSSFDETAFIREAKSLFIRLQTAYDNKNLADIKEFTSPEVYAEISLQLQEEPSFNHTEIIQLNAEVLDVPSPDNANTASVRFTGHVKENNIEDSLNEVWHFRNAFGERKWIVYGVQQN